MSELMEASRQWSTRPDDERFTDLHSMLTHLRTMRTHSREAVTSSRSLRAVPTGEGHKGLVIEGPNGNPVAPSNYAFGQLAQLAGAPAGYLRTLPAPVAADCINYGLHYQRDVADVGVLLQRDPMGEGLPQLRAATGPKYGRIWNADIVAGLVRQFGDGLSGRFRVPGEFGHAVDVTKANTTLFASDRDMFVFLADEENRIEMPGRRDGKTGSLARGFFVWNSEVGAATFGVKTFLFDYVCCNRIVWGAQGVEEIKIRHTSCAPDRFVQEITPALEAYTKSSQAGVIHALEDARAHRLDNVDKFLAERFGKGVGERVKLAHMADEGRPIETAWDAVTGATAYARSIKHQDARVELETEAGKILAAF